ncbi:MAG: hypothetical protein HQK52_23600 [Oligoflexia bacterium]|nr:hypothetical protein [Oligoflexia bacterium]
MDKTFATLAQATTFYYSSDVALLKKIQDYTLPRGIIASNFVHSLERAKDQMHRMFDSKIAVHAFVAFLDAHTMASPSWLPFYSYLREVEYKNLPIILVTEEMKLNTKDDGKEATSHSQSEALVLASRDALVKAIVFDPHNSSLDPVLKLLADTITVFYPEGIHFFKTEKNDKLKMITFPDFFDKTAMTALKGLEATITNEDTLVVFNYKYFKDKNVATFRAIYQLYSVLEKNRIPFKSINIKETLQGLLKNNGLYKSFKIHTPSK